MSKSRTVWAVVIAMVFLAAGYFTGMPGLIDDPEFLAQVKQFCQLGFDVAAAFAIIFARFKRS